MEHSITPCKFEQKGVAMDKLIANLAARFPELTEEDISLSVETIINAMSARLIGGGRIEFRGFGSFSVSAKCTDTGINPVLDTNDEADFQPVVIFKPGQVILERINEAA